MTVTRYSWTQPACLDCWRERNPGRAPMHLTEFAREIETCCHCGQETSDGIYVRVDPETVPYPTPVRDVLA